MKRRSFLQAIGSAVAALAVPAAKAASGYPFTEVAVSFSCDLTESALEDAIIELNEFQSETGKRIAFEPTQFQCYPNDEKAARKLMNDTWPAPS